MNNMLHRLGRLFLLWRSLTKDRRTPLATKIFPWVALLYALLPIDIVPDFVPLFGQLDDIGIVALLIATALKIVPSDLWKEHASAIDRRNVVDV